MPLGHEAGFAAGLVLYLFKGRPAHFGDAPAFHADQVIMVRAIELDFKARASIPAHDRRDKPALLQHLERAKNGGPAHSP